MAKLYKVEGYIVDINDNYNDKTDFQHELERIFDLHDIGLVPYSIIKESREFEWYDEIDLNNRHCGFSDCEKYFLPCYFNDIKLEDEEIEILQEIGCDVNFDSLSVNELKYWIDRLEKQADLYLYQAQHCNDEDTYHDLMFNYGDAKHIIDHIKYLIKKKIK